MQVEDGLDRRAGIDAAHDDGPGAALAGGCLEAGGGGLLLGEMRPDNVDEEIEIRVRLPDQDRVLSTLDTLKVRTVDGLVPLSNFVSRKPVAKLAEINRIDQERHLDVKADVLPGLVKVVETTRVNGEDVQTTFATLRPSGADGDVTALDGTTYKVLDRTGDGTGVNLQAGVRSCWKIF